MALEHKRIQDLPPSGIYRYDDARERASVEASSGRKYKWPAPPRHEAPRVPLFRLLVDGDELYFVNDSEETLLSVRSSTGGYQTCDDDVLTLTGSEGGGILYENVLPHEGVKIDEYDIILDSDFVLQPQVVIRSATMGERKFLGSASKGGFREEVLLWADEAGA